MHDERDHDKVELTLPGKKERFGHIGHQHAGAIAEPCTGYVDHGLADIEGRHDRPLFGQPFAQLTTAAPDVQHPETLHLAKKSDCRRSFVIGVVRTRGVVRRVLKGHDVVLARGALRVGHCLILSVFKGRGPEKM